VPPPSYPRADGAALAVTSSAHAVSSSRVMDLVRLLGRRVTILHWPAPSGERLSGQDIDCAVAGLDPWWPLRLTDGWRVCQFSRYDLRGWAWALERNGDVLHLDTLDDPRGVGRDALPIAALEAAPDRAEGPMEAPAHVRAAYLALKRVRKADSREAEWIRIRALASEDWPAFRSALHRLAGEQLGSLLYDLTRDGRSPNGGDLARAHLLQTLRRFRTPGRAAKAVMLQVTRFVDRLANPTGWSVLIVGPDGTGKSTVARSQEEALAPFFRKFLAVHWSPGMLPRPGAIVGRGEPDHSAPHVRPPHGRVLSAWLLAYYWLDFLIGGWLRTWPIRLRTGLVVTERGWWDIAVDPRRYRLDVPPRLVRGLGAFLPHPDVVLVLAAAPDVILARKGELSASELERQRRAWRENLPGGVAAVHLDTSPPPVEVAARTRAVALRAIEARAARRLGAGWASLRHEGRTRWWIPRGPASLASEALSIYQPVTARGRVAWRVARLAAGAGAFRMSPRGEAPPRPVREALAPYMRAEETMAVGRSNHPGRYLAAIIDVCGDSRAVAKVATDPVGTAALEREAEAIRAYGSLLPAPLAPPRILDAAPGLLLLEPVAWRPRPQPWRLDPDVAHALGGFYRSGVDDGADGGLAHGDFAPWNLLKTDRALVLLDWESARGDAPAFFDLCHFVIQSHTLLGQPSWDEVLAGFREGSGWVGAAVRGYADGAHLPAGRALDALESYLQATAVSVDSDGQKAGSRARLRLLRRLGR
jgi:hypothetical protein